MTVDKLNPKRHPINDYQSAALEKLAITITQLEIEIGEEFLVTSGFRSSEDQMRINPGVRNSAHMSGEAVDVSDVDGSIDHWCLDNLPILISLGLYLESPTQTPRWSHLAIIPPKSGNRVFT